MAQAQGSNSKLGWQFESAFSEVPSSPALNAIYMLSESFAGDFPLISSEILSPNMNPVQPTRGNQDATGGFKTHLAPQLASLIVKGVLGSTSTSGAGPYTHIGKVGTLPSMIFEKQIPDVNLYLLNNGCKMSTLDLTFPNSGPITADFTTMNRCVSMKLPYDAQSGNFTVGQVVTGGTSGAKALIVGDIDAGGTGDLIVTGISGTFADNEALTDPLTGAATANIPNGLGYTALDATLTDPTFTPWSGADITLVTVGGASVLNVAEAKIKIDRKLDGESFVIGGKGTRVSVNTGRAEISGSINVLLTDRALFDSSMRFQTSSLKITAQHGSGTGATGHEFSELFLPEIKFGSAIPKIDGPQGMLFELPIQAFYTNATANPDETALKWTIKNTQATL